MVDLMEDPFFKARLTPPNESVYAMTLGKINKHFEDLAQELIARWDEKVEGQRNIEHFEYIEVTAGCCFGRPDDVWHRAVLQVDVYVYTTHWFTKFRIVSDKLPTLDELVDRWEKFMRPKYGKTGRMDTGKYGTYDEEGNPKEPPKRSEIAKPKATKIDLADLGL